MNFGYVAEKLHRELYPVSEKKRLRFREVSPQMFTWETDLCLYTVELMDEKTVALSAYSRYTRKRMMFRIFRISGDEIIQVDLSTDLLKRWAALRYHTYDLAHKRQEKPVDKWPPLAYN